MYEGTSEEIYVQQINTRNIGLLLQSTFSGRWQYWSISWCLSNLQNHAKFQDNSNL